MKNSKIENKEQKLYFTYLISFSFFSFVCFRLYLVSRSCEKKDTGATKTLCEC